MGWISKTSPGSTTYACKACFSSSRGIAKGCVLASRISLAVSINRWPCGHRLKPLELDEVQPGAASSWTARKEALLRVPERYAAAFFHSLKVPFVEQSAQFVRADSFVVSAYPEKKLNFEAHFQGMNGLAVGFKERVKKYRTASWERVMRGAR